VDDSALTIYVASCERLEELGYSVEESSAELEIMFLDDETPYDGEVLVKAAAFMDFGAMVPLNELTVVRGHGRWSRAGAKRVLCLFSRLVFFFGKTSSWPLPTAGLADRHSAPARPRRLKTETKRKTVEPTVQPKRPQKVFFFKGFLA
jgi:hypothetical protein